MNLGIMVTFYMIPNFKEKYFINQILFMKHFAMESTHTVVSLCYWEYNNSSILCSRFVLYPFNFVYKF